MKMDVYLLKNKIPIDVTMVMLTSIMEALHSM